MSRRALAPELRATYDRLADPGPYRIDSRSIGARALRNACLAYLAAAGDVDLAAHQFDTATNMTDSLAALAELAATDTPAREAALAAFHARWKSEELVLDVVDQSFPFGNGQRHGFLCEHAFGQARNFRVDLFRSE